MRDILVHPVELRQISEQLKANAKKIDAALQAIDIDILSLKGDKFLGNRANAVQTNYSPKREALLKANNIVIHFANELLSAANVFENADKNAPSGVGGYGPPSGIDWGEVLKDQIKNGSQYLIELLKEIGGLSPVEETVLKLIKNYLEGTELNNEEEMHALLSSFINVGISTIIKGLFGNILLWSGGVQIVGNFVAEILEVTGQHDAAGILQNSLNVIDLIDTL